MSIYQTDAAILESVVVGPQKIDCSFYCSNDIQSGGGRGIVRTQTTNNKIDI